MGSYWGLAQISNIRLFDHQAAGKEVAHLSHAGTNSKMCSITDISFNENGFLMATASEEEVKIWDLRKLKCIKSFDLPNTIATTRFDQTGGFLAIGSTMLSIYAVKQDYSIAREFVCPGTNLCKSVCFGANGSFIAIGGSDHNLRIFS